MVCDFYIFMEQGALQLTRKIQKMRKENMKKWIALLLAAVLCLSLAACGSKKGESAVENIEINGKKFPLQIS